MKKFLISNYPNNCVINIKKVCEIYKSDLQISFYFKESHFSCWVYENVSDCNQEHGEIIKSIGIKLK
jgi:hypothetical protein